MKKSEFLEQAGGYVQDLRNYLMSYLRDQDTADDLAQDCILQAAELYERGRYDDTRSLKNWLFCMAYSRLVDYLRRQENHRKHLRLYPDQIRMALGWERSEPDVQLWHIPSPLPYQKQLPSQAKSKNRAHFQFQAKVLAQVQADGRYAGVSFQKFYVRHLLQTGFAGLPVSPAQRRLLQLRYVERLTYKQIATRLEEPLSTVMSRHAYAMRLLRGDYVTACHRRHKLPSRRIGARC